MSELSPLFLLVVACLSQGQENALQRIPDSLIECYNTSTGLNNKENLLPMTLQTLLSILRKVEDSEEGRNLNLLSLSTSILHRFKLDGIERNPKVLETSGVIPYSVAGIQFYKHKILLTKLIPQNNYKFPNETLTPIERCTLHLMLSKSIEKYQRGDEGTTCNKLSTSSLVSPFFRRKRQAEVESESGSGSGGLVGPATESTNTPPSTGDSTSPTATEEYPGKEIDNEDIEVILEETGEDNKGDILLVDDENIISHINVGSSGKYVEAVDHEDSDVIQEDVNSDNDDSSVLEIPDVVNRQTTSSVLSDCPVENGVIHTRWGAVSISSVIAGIVSGLETQTVSLENLVFANDRANSLQEAIAASAQGVDNRWAATISGDLAEMVLHQGPLGQMKIGAVGGWNNTGIPRWYFIQSKDDTNNPMTDPDIRGGIDGLTLARNIMSWQSQATGLRLSEVLDLYYSETGLFQNRFRACQRKNNFAGVAPSSEMEPQTTSFGVVLDPQSLTPALLSYNVISNYSSVASRQLVTYVPSGLQDPLCTSSRTSGDSSATNSSSVNPGLDLVLVVDTAWDFTYIQQLLSLVMREIQVDQYFSNITVLAGSNLVPLVNSTNSHSAFFSNLTQANYSSVPSGFDLRQALGSHLLTYFRQKMDEERRLNIAGGLASAVLFIPPQGYSISDADLQASINSFQNFKLRVPDVKFFYLLTGNGARFNNLVDDHNRDILTLNTGLTALETTSSSISQALSRVQRRIINSNCGSDWQHRSYTSAQFSDAIDPSTVNIYRLHANYFFSSTSGKIKVQGSGSGSLRVCSSRRSESPHNVTTSDVTCKVINSDSYEISLSSACEGYTYISQCPPLYLSVESTSEPTVFLCASRSICRFVGNVQYTISHQDLGCAAGICRLLANPFLLCSTIIIVVSTHFFNQ
uniref:(California timema) hypothetical protein n=1 Tax=Timema californicum TaxID=61474 RepID=A0A7R9JB83_TIMCA|nr:unnamed protein product [Timema californicum]